MKREPVWPMRLVIALWFLIVLLLAYHAEAEPNGIGWANEADIAAAWCDTKGGLYEHTTEEGQLVDCLFDRTGSPDIAWEFHWAENWIQALANAIYIRQQSEAMPGIVLIYRDRKGDKHAYDLLLAAHHAGWKDEEFEVMVRDLEGEYHKVSLRFEEE